MHSRHLLPRSFAALVVAVALVFSTLGIVAATTAPATAASADITSGSFVWGFKESWRKYIADGATTGDGATITGQVPNGTQIPYPAAFSFPIESGSYEPETRTTTLRLKGYVHFRSWFGQVTPGQYALDTKFSDLTVTISPATQEIRGTHTGYSRSDPGGALHVDEDVVLASMDITAATTSFADDATSWTGIPTVAGDGFSIYGPGTTLDAASISYPGPGGMPDLTEKFDAPGVPVIDAGEVWATGSADYNTNGGARELEVSGDGKRLFSFETSPTTGGKLVVTAVNAATMKTEGTPYEFNYAPGSFKYVRTAIDPETDTLFFVTGKDGASGLETTVRSLNFSKESGVFAAGVVGRLRDAAGAVNVGPLVWNGIKRELFTATNYVTRPDILTADEAYRFVRSGSQWDVSRTDLRYPTTGDFAGATANVASALTASGSSSQIADRLAVASDGSYILAAGATTVYRDAASVTPRITHRMPALRLVFGADGAATMTEIAGTVQTATVLGTYYGYSRVITTKGGVTYLHGDGQSLQDYLRVDLAGGSPTVGTPVTGPDIFTPYGMSVLASSMIDDPSHGLLWATDPQDVDGKSLKVVDDDGVVAAYRIADFADNYFGERTIHALADGALIIPAKDPVSGTYGWQRVDVLGIAPAVTEQPEPATVELAADEASRSISFSAAIDTDIGGDLQWQSKPVGASKFVDVQGATSTSLAVDAGPRTDGSRYRLKVSNGAGTVVSDEVTLSVTYSPRFAVQPKSVTARPGTIANFNAEVLSNPGTTSTAWQRKSGGFWVDIVDSDDNFAVSGNALTVRETDVAQSGTQFRLKAVSSRGTAYSSVARLTVEAPQIEDGSIAGATLVWTGSKELQKAPPFGGSSFFSAGVSDGQESTYAAAKGNVSIFQVDGQSQVPATWSTRAAHLGGSSTQTVVVADGAGRIAADGSATIEWDGSWSVNFYGGLVPFTLTDPVLTVDEQGKGTLKADLSGYGSTQEDPSVREPIASVEDVTVATFDDVAVDPDGFTITPDYDGVEVDVPVEFTPQKRSGEWGGWPQPFVGFHLATGLSSYWYTSGGSADADKAPSDIRIGSFDVARTPPVVVAPAIVVQPSRTASTIGTKARFQVTATGTDLAYLWQRRVGSSWIDLSDERSPSIALAKVRFDDDGAQFRVKVSNSAGSVTSAVARLDVAAIATSAEVTRSKRSQKYKSALKKRVLLTVKVRSATGGPAAGRVRFYDGSRKIATVRVGSGRAKLRLPRTLKVGSHRIKAVYEPYSNGVFARSTTRTITVKVTR